MIIPNIKNLIKDDFSDFTAYGGATVTKNKTFPIDVFKGGRNLQIGYTNQLLSVNGTVDREDDIATLRPNGANNYQAVRFEQRNIKLPVGTYTLSFMAKGNTDLRLSNFTNIIAPEKLYTLNEDNWIFCEVTFVKEVVDDGTLRIYINEPFVKPTSYISIKDIQIEKGSTPTEYSPAPEDGYGYTGSDGAYHIQTSGGTSPIKYRAYTIGTENIETLSSMKIHPFLPMRLYDNRTNSNLVPVNETTHWENASIGTLPANIQARVELNSRPEDPLDFIASEPTIYDETSINSMNILDILQEQVIDNEEKFLTLLDGDVDLSDNFIQFKMSTEGSLYARNMRMVEIELHGKYELLNKWVNIKRGVSSANIDNGNLQTIDYGDFGIIKQEYDDTTEKTNLVAYDKMILTQIAYDSSKMGLTYPLTVSQVIHRLAIVCNLDLVVNATDNIYELIHSDLWANQSFTYSDILEQVAQATGSMFSIIDNKLTLHKPQTYDFTLEGKFNNLKINEKYGKANILNISQEPQHYNSYEPSNALDIPIDDRKELVFINNPILNQNMDYWKTKIFPLVTDIEYQTFSGNALGYGIFDVGDIINIYEKESDSYLKTMITKEVFTDKHSVITDIESHKPFAYKGQYVVETDTKRQGQKTMLIVDQLNGVIEALVQSYDDLNDKTAQLRIDVDSIELQVENIGNGNILPNGSGEMGYYGYIGGSSLVYTDDLVYQGYMTYSHGFIPKIMLGSLSEWGLSFISNGYDITPSAYVVPDTPYAYKAKVNRFKPFSIQLLEFKNVEDSENLVIHKSTTHTFNNPMQYVSFTQDLDTETQFTRLRYNRTGVTYLDRLEITEVMFNRGVPSEWQQSATNAMIYSQTTRTQLSDRIDDVVSTVEVIDGEVFVNKTNITQLGNEIELKVNVNGVISAINLTSEQAKILANHISLEGLTTINGHFKVLPNGDVEFTNAKGTNVNLSGKITTNDLTATGGKIGDFSIRNGNISSPNIELRNDYLRVGGSKVEKFIGASSDDINIGNIGNKFTNFYLNGHLLVMVATPVGQPNFFRNTTVYSDSVVPTHTAGTFATLGVSNSRFNNVYLVNQPNVSSDTRYKSMITDIDPLLIKHIGENVSPKSYLLEDGQTHFGYIAQDVERALYKYNLEKHGHARAVEEVSQFALLSKSESYMSLLYGEINVIMDSYNRSVNNQLEERIKALEGEHNERTSNSR